eukprot:5237067-Pleurochrysis_carterae.AAC.1
MTSVFKPETCAVVIVYSATRSQAKESCVRGQASNRQITQILPAACCHWLAQEPAPKERTATRLLRITAIFCNFSKTARQLLIIAVILTKTPSLYEFFRSRSAAVLPLKGSKLSY